jgi:hypothetical protein
MGRVIAVAVAIAGFAATQLPEESFADLDVGSHDCGWFRLGVAIALAAIVVCLFLVASGISKSFGDDVQTIVFVGDVLNLCAFLCPAETEPATRYPDKPGLHP